MYKLYNVNNKIKSDIKGFWQDNNKKIYIDNININYCYTDYKLLNLMRKSFLSGEKACFYTDNDKAFILSNDGKKTILRNKKTLKRHKLSVNEIKYLLSIYEGLTIFKKEYCYIIEIFY